MKTLISQMDVPTINGIYRFYQYHDGNALPQIELYKIENEKEVSIRNVLEQVKKLNDEFGFRIEYAPKNRKHLLNTREFSEKFIKEFKKQ